MIQPMTIQGGFLPSGGPVVRLWGAEGSAPKRRHKQMEGWSWEWHESDYTQWWFASYGTRRDSRAT